MLIFLCELRLIFLRTKTFYDFRDRSSNGRIQNEHDEKKIYSASD